MDFCMAGFSICGPFTGFGNVWTFWKEGTDMEDRSRMMEEMPVSRLIWKLTLPSVAGVMAYNL